MSLDRVAHPVHAHFPASGEHYFERLRHATAFHDRSLRRDEGAVSLAEVSRPRPGQRFAFVMDTRLCDAVFELAEGADLLVIESTFLREDAALAHEYGHLTAAQAGRVAESCGVSCSPPRPGSSSEGRSSSRRTSPRCRYHAGARP